MIIPTYVKLSFALQKLRRRQKKPLLEEKVTYPLCHELMSSCDEDEGILVRCQRSFLTDAAREHIKTVCHHFHNEQSIKCVVATIRVIQVILLWHCFLMICQKQIDMFQCVWSTFVVKYNAWSLVLKPECLKNCWTDSIYSHRKRLVLLWRQATSPIQRLDLVYFTKQKHLFSDILIFINHY